MSNPLAAFALSVVNLLKTGATAYTYETLPHGSGDIPLATLTGAATSSIYTDCSGWVNYVLDSVAPLHEAVASAERNDPVFNPGTVSAYGGTVTIDEAQQPWSRADVLSYLFGTVANGSDGFTTIADLSTLQAGDIIAYATGIFTNPGSPNASSDPTLVATNDTGHTMIVVGTPVAVPTDDWSGTGFEAADVAAVYAVPVVDSSNVSHFVNLPDLTEPQGDTRSYTVPAHPPNLPAGVPTSALSGGGVGGGTLWFAADASGAILQVRFNEGDPWFPNTVSGAGSQAALSVSAARLTGGINLSGSMLDVNNNLVVDVFPNAAPVLGGVPTNTQPEVLTGSGGLWVTGGGFLQLGAGNGFSGGMSLDGATVDLAGAGAAGSGAVTFVAGVASRLQINTAAALPAGTVAVIAAGDTIDLSYLPYNAASTAALVGGTLTVVSGTTSVQMAATAASAAPLFYTARDAAGGTLVGVACYCAGTRIATPGGEVPVEQLAAGDLVLTADGREEPVRWIGRRSYSGRLLAGRADLLPVCIRAGALAEGVPRRDLLVSPKHAMLIDGLLIPAAALVNGTTVTRQDGLDRVDYVHIELSRHEAILAEGAASESFLDDDSRGMFQNADSYDVSAHPPPEAGFCAPRVEAGPALEAVRQRMLARMAA